MIWNIPHHRPTNVLNYKTPYEVFFAYNGVSGHPCRLSSDSLKRDIFCNSILA